MNKNLEEISDGKRYGLNDMVRAACNDCAGCSSCCEDMGESIILDPLDIYELTKNLNTTFENLLKEQIELHVVDGMILPNLKMTDKNVCPFLKEKRCSIHSFRPGICRVFPLGRIYEENRLDYFLQVEGCVKENRSKVKVSKWIDTPELKRNEQFKLQWHDLLSAMTDRVAGEDEGKQREENLLLLRLFYLLPYEGTTDFYSQFTERMEHWNEQIG